MNIEDLISQYIDGELSSEAEAELHHRLSVSPDDRRRFREHVELREAARSRKLQHHPTQAMEMALFARLAAEEGAEIPDSQPMIVAEPMPEPHEVEMAAELRPLEPAAAPLPRTLAVDAPPVRREREPARRRRLVPLLVPFVIGVLAMAVIWQLFSSSSDRSGEIAMKSSNSSAPTAGTSPAPSATSPTDIEGEDVAAVEGAPVSPEASVSSPLSEPSVMSDAGPRYADQAAERKDVGRGSASRGYRQQAPSGNVMADGMASTQGYGQDDRVGVQMNSIPPSSPPVDFDSNYPDNERGGGGIGKRDANLDRARRSETANAADVEEASQSAQSLSTTPIEPPSQREAAPATPIENDSVERNYSLMTQPQSVGIPEGAATRNAPPPPPSRASDGSKKIGPPAGMLVQLGDAYFDSDRATLKRDSRESLDRLTDLLNSYPAMRIEIQGHTDSDGNDNRNIRLSEDRARSVMNYLRQQGIPADRMETKGYGPNSPLAPNTTAAGKKLNRRVVVVVKDYSYTR